jgi:O-antigen ligase
MSKAGRYFMFVAAVLLTLFSAYLVGQAGTNGYKILLFTSAILGGLAVIAWPFLGLFAILILSPIKTSGSEIVLLAKLAGLFTVGIVFLRLLSRNHKIFWTGIEAPVLVMGAGMALSLFRTTNTGAVFDTLLSLVSLYGLVLLIVNMIETDKQLLGLSLTYLVSGIYPIIQSFIQRAQGPSYVGQQFVRVSGTFTLATGLGGFLIPYTLVALALFFYSGLSRPVRLFVIGAFAAGYIALIFTVSRGALAGALIGFALLVFLLRSVLLKRGPIMVFLTATIIIVVTQQYWSSVQGRLVTPLVNFANSGTSSDENILARNEELDLLLDITLDNHFMGTGIGNYASAALRYQVIYKAPALPLDPHNILLYFFGEVGIVAALGFFWLLFSLFMRMVAYHRSLKDKTSSITFYLYISSVSAIVGYSIFLITHSGLFTNELWISIALLIVSTRLGTETVQLEEQPLRNAISRVQGKKC